jgi:hydroxypyruvate isomerase
MGSSRSCTTCRRATGRPANAASRAFPDAPADKARETFVANLRFAAAKLEQAQIRLLIEPCNTRDIPGFYLNRSQQALEVIREVGSSNLFLQYDIYHMPVMEGDLAPTIERNRAFIRHLQLADNPGRNEPGTGEINYRFLFGVIERLGYDGWVGCEYKPKARTVEGLGWIKSHLGQF